MGYEISRHFGTVVSNVRKLLEASERCRNNDNALVANYWYKYDTDFVVEIIRSEDKQPAVRLADYAQGRLTSPSIIERARRRIQEECALMTEVDAPHITLKLEMMQRYMPTDPKIIKQRKISSRLWKDFLNNGKINLIIKEDKLNG